MSVDIWSSAWPIEHMLKCLNRVRRENPAFHHTDLGLISTWPNVTLPIGVDRGPGTVYRSLCGLNMRDVWLRADNPIVADVLGQVRVCRTCSKAQAAR